MGRERERDGSGWVYDSHCQVGCGALVLGAKSRCRDSVNLLIGKFGEVYYSLCFTDAKFKFSVVPITYFLYCFFISY